MKKSKLIALVCALIGLATPAQALNFSFTGNLSGDDDVQLFTFTVGATSTVTLRTLSYAGGTNAAGALIADGGFDPILALFSGTGPTATYINQNDDGSSPDVGIDATTGETYDTFLQALLAPGTYTVSVAQYSNFAVGPTLGDGFDGSGTSNWQDATGDLRDSHWAFDILNVEQASTSTPEGGSGLILLSMGLGACFVIRRKNRR